ncbi:MAG: potassium channel family protein [Nitratireductor sp.]|uniref:potassium channel family protein n=1 Tax=Roseitalea porphyridii TaxID=1852022 RepID=UPI0032EF87BE
MFVNLLLGTLVISATVVIHTLGLIALTHATGRLTGLVRMDGRRSRILAMVSIVLGLFAIMTVEVWLWAVSHYWLGVVEGFETALYFSVVSFSTLGYGDVLPAHHWRLFAGLEGVNGFLLIGWSTAYLIAAGIRIGPFRQGVHF